MRNDDGPRRNVELLLLEELIWQASLIAMLAFAAVTLALLVFLVAL